MYWMKLFNALRILQFYAINIFEFTKKAFHKKCVDFPETSYHSTMSEDHKNIGWR